MILAGFGPFELEVFSYSILFGCLKNGHILVKISEYEKREGTYILCQILIFLLVASTYKNNLKIRILQLHYIINIVYEEIGTPCVRKHDGIKPPQYKMVSLWHHC